MRLADKIWDDLRLFKFHRKMTWNKLMRYFMEREEEVLNNHQNNQS
jgi:hypothetical protein